jgi:hypothetical protein
MKDIVTITIDIVFNLIMILIQHLLRAWLYKAMYIIINSISNCMYFLLLYFSLIPKIVLKDRISI